MILSVLVGIKCINCNFTAVIAQKREEGMESDRNKVL